MYPPLFLAWLFGTMVVILFMETLDAEGALDRVLEVLEAKGEPTTKTHLKLSWALAWPLMLPVMAFGRYR